MKRRAEFEKRMKTGKRFAVFFSCLLLLSGMIGAIMCGVSEDFEKRTGAGNNKNFEEAEIVSFRMAGGFDNPVDDKYLPLIYENAQNEKRRQKLLIKYEKAWQKELEDYLTDYQERCNYQSDKEIVDEYRAAVFTAVEAQKNLMEYMGAKKDEVCWYSIQTYRCAFIKCIRGEVAEKQENRSGSSIEAIPDDVYEKWGEFGNDIDRQYVFSMYDGSKAEAGKKQEEFDIAWCNELCTLTMELYEKMDEEGKRLMDVWQVSREQWKAALDSRLWWTPEELNAAEEGESFLESGTWVGIMEAHGWINRLYCLQLQALRF